MGSEQSSAHQGSLHSLQGMGFSEEQAIVALQAANGDLNRAVQLLLDQPQVAASTAPPPVPRPPLPPTRAQAMAEEAASLQRAIEESKRDTAPSATARARQMPAAQSHALAAAEARMRATQGRGAPPSRGAQFGHPAPAPPKARPPAATAAARVPAQAVAQLSGRTAGGTPEERVQRCAQALAGHAQAVDILITSLNRALEHPNDEKYRRVNPSNPAFAATVGATPGGVDMLYAVGFEPVHGHLVLQKRDPALLWLGKSALETVRTSGQYQASKEAVQVEAALGLSEKSYSEEDHKRRAQWAAKVPAEPAEGEAGNSLICCHVGGGHVWRRFESCSTLEDVANFVRSLPGTPLSGLKLSNVTMSPEVPLDLEMQKGLTLQRLDMWPTGHVRVGGPGMPPR